MSMNLYISASGSVTTPSGKSFEHVEIFDLQQTTTEESYKVINSENKLEAYEKLSSTRSSTFKDLKKWIKKMEEYGFTIEWSVM